ncbi:MAG: hypothetical protein GEV00_01030 [Actinophytocola sp.]|nr:hypothetical protein [Actinophytocola sp.]
MESDDELACHELLLLLAGRLPDVALWRFRDWLGEGQLSVLASTVPKSLLRHGIELDQREHALLSKGLIPHGADFHQLSATLRVGETAVPRYTFSDTPPERASGPDSVAALLDAALRGRPDVGEVRASWRHDERGRNPKRVLLVAAVSGWPRLTGELQRVLRVLGDDEPSIEVLPENFEMPDYHREALANSRPVSVGAVGATA